MAKNHNSRRSKFKRILSAILVFVLIAVAVGSISVFAAVETKTIASSKFTRGSLDDKGEYVIDNTAIYTKEAFECRGLYIQSDFEASLTYDVYFYDVNKEFIEAKKGYKKLFDEEVHPEAVTARVVIHPNVPEDVDDDEFKIKIWEVYSYARKLKITVARDQDNLYGTFENLYNASKTTQYYSIWSDDEAAYNILEPYVHEGKSAKVTQLIAVNGEYDKYDIFIRFTEPAKSDLHAAIGNDEGEILESKKAALYKVYLGNGNISEWVKITVKVPKGVEDVNAYLRVSMPYDAECYIFGYND